jgi:HPt (histidine-containing phosphotransfer) domain-containing protein
LHKQLAEILEKFTNDLKADLDELNQKMAQNGREADSYFMKMSSHVEDFTSKIQSSLESVSVKAEVSQTFLKHDQSLIQEQ